jgi:hypothetical protein
MPVLCIAHDTLASRTLSIYIKGRHRSRRRRQRPMSLITATRSAHLRTKTRDSCIFASKTYRACRYSTPSSSSSSACFLDPEFADRPLDFMYVEDRTSMLVKFAPPAAAWPPPPPVSKLFAEASVMPLDPGGDAASFPSCTVMLSRDTGTVLERGPDPGAGGTPNSSNAPPEPG